MKKLKAILICVGVVLTHSSFSQAPWLQRGNYINGPESESYFGTGVSLSADGNRMAVGAPFYEEAQIGYAAVYELVDNTWTPLGSTFEGISDGDKMGYDLALSPDGNRLVLGMIGGNGGTGLLRVYDWNGSEWNLVGEDINGESVGDGFGFSVDISADGNRIIGGALYNSDNGNWAGNTLVFDWNGSVWTQVGSSIDGEAAEDRSGSTVSISADGSIIAIGAYLNDGFAFNAGHTRVFTYNGSDWIQMGEDIDGEEVGAQFGSSVSLSADGERLAIGAKGAGDSNEGSVQVYEWNGSTWTELGSAIYGDSTDDWLGYSVDISNDGNRVVCGAISRSFSSNGGFARIMEWNGTDWMQACEDIAGPTNGAEMGSDVSFAANGGIVAVTAAKFNVRRGRAYVYEDPTITALHEVKEKMFSIFPIPAHDWISINTKGEGNYLLHVFDISGRVILSTNINPPNYSLDVSQLSAGMYVLQLETDKGDKETHSLVVNH